MNKHHQFLLAIFSICLVIALGLSTVNKTIHDGLFHPNFVTDNNPTPSGCTGHHEGECDHGQSNKHSEGCDSLSCPVNIFSNGVLALDFAPAQIAKPSIKGEFITEHLISHHSEKEKKSHLVRGPPEEKQV